MAAGAATGAGADGFELWEHAQPTTANNVATIDAVATSGFRFDEVDGYIDEFSIGLNDAAARPFLQSPLFHHS